MDDDEDDDFVPLIQSQYYFNPNKQKLDKKLSNPYHSERNQRYVDKHALLLILFFVNGVIGKYDTLYIIAALNYRTLSLTQICMQPFINEIVFVTKEYVR